jgi:hypothetical protein
MSAGEFTAESFAAWQVKTFDERKAAWERAGVKPTGCHTCKKLQAKVEDLEGALSGAHNTIRQLRDRDSVVEEKK